MQSLILPLLFLTTTMEEIQSVGTSTGIRIPVFTKRSSSWFKGSLIAKGTFLTGSTTGGTVRSSSRWSFPFSFPSPKRISSNSLTKSCFVGGSSDGDIILSAFTVIRPNCWTVSAPRSAVWSLGTTVYLVSRHCSFFGFRISTLTCPRGLSSNLLNMTRLVCEGWRRVIWGSR